MELSGLMWALRRFLLCVHIYSWVEKEVGESERDVLEINKGWNYLLHRLHPTDFSHSCASYHCMAM